MEELSFVIKGDEKEGPVRENDEIIRVLHECITTLQKIKFICQRAKRYYMDEKDIDDILKVLEGKV
ncbi:hypothetical protein [Bacillus haynesii]|uniref:hypothetical protein n=1 Tax=Bacillus haynesii TaxID=1925021 RepID=UPI002280ABD2|nr:hypothetical protein [Bacillus haynesii]MCY7914099.1 hypothetical protein [Bacillus haynesii]MCY7928102.1 hypothetical protein [Bacillus haynesii]MCY8772383.1 hypothetical protein [Bacillus haynesii]MEC0789458.1 hypothetical protein [Bacillus haynesii]MEC1654759.1 hypothetical protein [Bacillus haynesii]